MWTEILSTFCCAAFMIWKVSCGMEATTEESTLLIPHRLLALLTLRYLISLMKVESSVLEIQ
jgi:hypothetical protein